jgi:hypothetical protein
VFSRPCGFIYVSTRNRAAVLATAARTVAGMIKTARVAGILAGLAQDDGLPSSRPGGWRTSPVKKRPSGPGPPGAERLT